MKSIKSIHIQKQTPRGNSTEQEDKIVVEAPLQIIIAYTHKNERRKEILSVTMRTPGDDFNLAAGFLFNEAIITKASDLIKMRYTSDDESILLAELNEHVEIKIDEIKRNFIANSACGFCGRLDDVSQKNAFIPAERNLKITASIIQALPALLQSSQSLFSETGGAHAVALVNTKGELLHISEDVGRHNAMDKLVGKMLMQNALPLHDAVVLFSGRLSYELVQKSLMAGISIICAIGAPSSLAVELAEDYGVTIIGFLKNSSFNIYCGAQRIIQF